LDIIASFVATILLFVYSPKGFFPAEDIGQLRITVAVSEETSFKTMIALQDQAASDPNVETSISILGSGQRARGAIQDDSSSSSSPKVNAKR